LNKNVKMYCYNYFSFWCYCYRDDKI